MTNDINESPFIKMRNQFLKEKDAIVERYEAEIVSLKKRIEELENPNEDNFVDVSPEQLNESFFDAEK